MLAGSERRSLLAWGRGTIQGGVVSIQGGVVSIVGPSSPATANEI